MPSATASWVVESGWVGVVGPGPYTRDELDALLAEYAAQHNFDIEEVKQNARYVESKELNDA